METHQTYIDRCPACGERFVAMTPDEFAETHAIEDCPRAPLSPKALEVAQTGPSVGDLLDAAWRRS